MPALTIVAVTPWPDRGAGGDPLSVATGDSARVDLAKQRAATPFQAWRLGFEARLSNRFRRLI